MSADETVCEEEEVSKLALEASLSLPYWGGYTSLKTLLNCVSVCACSRGQSDMILYPDKQDIHLCVSVCVASEQSDWTASG